MKAPRKPSSPSEDSSTKSPRVKDRGTKIGRLERTFPFVLDRQRKNVPLIEVAYAGIGLGPA